MVQLMFIAMVFAIYWLKRNICVLVQIARNKHNIIWIDIMCILHKLIKNEFTVNICHLSLLILRSNKIYRAHIYKYTVKYSKSIALC